jgi:hypothetical protein
MPAVSQATAAVRQYRDDFLDNSRNAKLWDQGSYANYSTDVAVLEQNNRLEISPQASQAASKFGGYTSPRNINFTQRWMQVEVVQTTNAASTVTSMNFGIASASDRLAFIVFYNGSLLFRWQNAGGFSDTSVTYNATNHRFWRLEHDGTNILWRTSADGSTWTTQRTVATPITITAVKLNMDCAGFGSVASPGTGIYDNFTSNIPT